MNRRDVIKLAAGAAVLTFVPAVFARNDTEVKSGKKRLAMVIDLRRCNGCKACTVACGVENGNRPNEHRTEIAQKSVKIGESQFVMSLPLLCNNCDDPSCVSVCPTRATFKRSEDGIVVVDSTVCIGCKYCMLACPYSMRFINSDTDVIDKCNFCIQRSTNGMYPACVETCIGEARVFGDLNDPTSRVSQLLAKEDAMVLQYGAGTVPNVYYIGLSQIECDNKYRLDNNLSWIR